MWNGIGVVEGGFVDTCNSCYTRFYECNVGGMVGVGEGGFVDTCNSWYKRC